MRLAWLILKRATLAWVRNDAPTLGAALAFYAVFSVAPLLIIAIAISGLVFGQDAARGEIVSEVQDLVGAKGGQAIQSMLHQAGRPGEGVVATVLGVILLLFGASGVFVQLQSSLNVIWKVAPASGAPWSVVLRRRCLSFAMTLVVGFLLLASLVISAALAAVSRYFEGAVPGGFRLPGQAVYGAVSFGVITLLFALVFKILPDAVIRWRDVWAGSGITALLFVFGKEIIGVYLSHQAVGSAYGAAGSLAALLLWVFYSSQVAFLGAEITHAYAELIGSRRRRLKAEVPHPASC